MATDAQRERAEMSELLDEVGPDVPTLCGQWSARDLTAHLLLRERRLDAAPGIFLSLLAGYTKGVQDRIAARPWPELVEELRSGPPVWSPVRYVDAQANGMELFVHHEDVRRARSGWESRVLPAAQQDDLWSKLKVLGRLGYRHSPVGVDLRRPVGTTITAKGGPRVVTLIGEPAELVLHAFGRDEVNFEFEGDQADVDAVLEGDRSL